MTTIETTHAAQSENTEANITSPSTSSLPSFFRVFQRLRWRIFRNSWRLLVGASLMRLITIFLCCVVIWGGLFGVSYYGFRELRLDWQLTLSEQIFGTLFNLTFLTLTFLLIFSTAIILYTSLFATRESAFLLVTPATPDHIFAYKFQSALGFSSWAFLLLGTPILLAYGLEVKGGAPWYYYIIVPLYFFGFIFIPGSIGALGCLVFVNYFPRHRKQVLMFLLLILAVMVGWWAYAKVFTSARRMLRDADALADFFGSFNLLRNSFSPASWMAEGILAAGKGNHYDSLYYLALIWSNGLALYLVTTATAKYLYRRGYNLLASGGLAPVEAKPSFLSRLLSLKPKASDPKSKPTAEAPRKRYSTTFLDWLLGVPLLLVNRQTRELILKDFKSFRRDPAQWAQLVIFLGLGMLYFVSMRHFYRADFAARYRNGIALLNFVATSLMICAYTGRFVYPMLSLEGNKFWILGLLPLDRKRLVYGKFVFSLTVTLAVGEALVLVSNTMLGLPAMVVICHVVTIAVIALGLSGLSVGMGATMPNFRETDPSKIAVGFGGTMNLILGLLYQVGVILLMIVPCHLYVWATYGERKVPLDNIRYWLALGTVTGLVICGLAVVMPLRAGVKALRKVEF